jgi:CRISPR-associated exonuclease Cas4
MYQEDELIPLSALQHLVFCERQCALIHVERMWLENRLTAEGRIMHERVHHADPETRRKVRFAYAVPLRSLRLGVSGQADVVEFHAGGAVVPVEHKRGKPKPDHSDAVQLCAQAMCLEEMLDVAILEGSLFYGKTRRRKAIAFDAPLRRETEAAADRLHELIRSGRTPPPVFEAKCKSCSFLTVCMPETLSKNRSVHRYLMKTKES